MPHTKNLEPWRINENDFPQNGSLRQKIEFCLRYAILAPSPYNTQPWYFTLEDDTVSVYADRRLALPVLDRDDRQLEMSCAAALFNLRLALRYFGFNETMQLLPNPSNEDLIARVQVEQSHVAASQEDKELFKSITKRHHNRSAYKKQPVEKEKIDILEKAAQQEGALLYICEGDERAIISHMVAEGDHIQMNDKSFRRELASWTHIRRFESGDGFPQYARPYSEIMSSSKPLVLRRFETEPGKIVRGEDIGENSPLILILCSERGGSVNRLYTGQAYMRLCLEVERMGLSVSPMNQPCEVPDLRLRLQDEIEQFQGRAHYILRIGYAEPSVNHSPRRPLQAFIEQEVFANAEQHVDNNMAGGIFAKFGRIFKFGKSKNTSL